MPVRDREGGGLLDEPGYFWGSVRVSSMRNGISFIGLARNAPSVSEPVSTTYSV